MCKGLVVILIAPILTQTSRWQTPRWMSWPRNSKLHWDMHPTATWTSTETPHCATWDTATRCRFRALIQLTLEWLRSAKPSDRSPLGRSSCQPTVLRWPMCARIATTRHWKPRRWMVCQPCIPLTLHLQACKDPAAADTKMAVAAADCFIWQTMVSRCILITECICAIAFRRVLLFRDGLFTKLSISPKWRLLVRNGPYCLQQTVQLAWERARVLCQVPCWGSRVVARQVHLGFRRLLQRWLVSVWFLLSSIL